MLGQFLLHNFYFQATDVNCQLVEQIQEMNKMVQMQVSSSPMHCNEREVGGPDHFVAVKIIFMSN